MSEKKLLKLTISKVDGPVFDGEVSFVTVPGIAGEMTILANHEALISPLKAGKITIESANADKQEVEIASGTLEISHNHATILI